MLASWKSRLYIAAGSIALALGVLGIPIPLLPTTPFLLLAAFCFARGNQRWHDWLNSHWIFGPYIVAFREKRGLTRRQKLNIAVSVTVTLSATIYLLGPGLVPRVMVGIFWAIGMTLLYSYRSAPRG